MQEETREVTEKLLLTRLLRDLEMGRGREKRSRKRAKGKFSLQEKDNDAEWWSEKGKRGEMEEVKEEEGRKKKTEQNREMEIHRLREKRK